MQVAMVVGELFAGQSVGPREKISTVFSAPRPSFRVLVRVPLYALNCTPMFTQFGFEIILLPISNRKDYRYDVKPILSLICR